LVFTEARKMEGVPDATRSPKPRFKKNKKTSKIMRQRGL
jgi:hypothetical protein